MSAFYIDRGITLVLGNDSRNGILGRYISRISWCARCSNSIGSCLSKTTSKDATVHGSGIDVDECILVGCRVHFTEGTTAIDITQNKTSTTQFDTSLRSDVHRDVTTDNRCLTSTTTIDVMVNSTAGHVHLRITIHIGCITTSIDIGNGIAAGILDMNLGVTLNGLVRIIRIGSHSRHIATTIDTTCNRGVPLDGEVGSTHLTQVIQIYVSTNIIRCVTCQMAARRIIGQRHSLLGSIPPFTLYGVL